MFVIKLDRVKRIWIPVFHTEFFAGGGKLPQTEDLMHDVDSNNFCPFSRPQKVFVTSYITWVKKPARPLPLYETVDTNNCQVL